MRAQIPDVLWPEIEHMTQSEAGELYNESFRLRQTRVPAVLDEWLRSQGFSEEFAKWYSNRVDESCLDDTTLIVEAPEGVPTLMSNGTRTVRNSGECTIAHQATGRLAIDVDFSETTLASKRCSGRLRSGS